MTGVKLTPLDLERIRRNMRITLTVTPRHVFKALWEPKERSKDRYRDELVDRLTQGWEKLELHEPARDEIGRTISE